MLTLSHQVHELGMFGEQYLWIIDWFTMTYGIIQKSENCTDENILTVLGNYFELSEKLDFDQVKTIAGRVRETKHGVTGTYIRFRTFSIRFFVQTL